MTVRRAPRVAVATALVVALMTALLAVLLPSPATAAGSTASAAAGSRHPEPPVLALDYDALGDSYGSGYGVPPYTAACGRSDAAYAELLDGLRWWWFRFVLDDFVACAGATTTTLVEGAPGGVEPSQLDALDLRTRLVTLSIGGNDIGWGLAVRDCLLGTDAACATTQEAIRARIRDDLPALLDGVYRKVRRRAPLSVVVVTGYPHLFSPEAGAYLGASPAEQEQLNVGADLLNATIRAAARRHGFAFVDVTARFAGHGANAADPWILGLTDPGAFHPTTAGYVAYADAVAAALGTRR
ncbi:SGNH/GDSL hydrolase family protein [Nocardioides campestrisoli]|uniref:SGNH/GDSL hydrolase family protein n=1 Tax=Nocardioides campestrisoli TaxID=2736757 RepID=UPI001C625A4F|nr:SGNH/GDSL hydrolase family protein [Nocardioides campestrisoli]